MELLEKTFRWFGSDFGVTLEDVKQTGATGVVTPLHNVPVGEVWSKIMFDKEDRGIFEIPINATDIG